ncbi:MAG: FtsQ-type POTRA domain-containing protein [Treponema sp.]|jgi:cell division protein FtsQ|nr:FtsQ-type POTRA domain-containing protein [Treponema sp.]
MMPPDFSYTAEETKAPFGSFAENTETENENPRGTSRKIEKGLKRLFIVAGLILAAEFIWLFGVSPCIPLSTLEVQGFPGFDGGEVLRYAGIDDKASFLSVNPERTEKLLAGHYLVDSAKVIKRFPDRLSIFLEPRRAVALSLAAVQGRLLPVYFDRHGVIFRIGMEKGTPPSSKLPIISGLVIEDPVPGMRLPAALGPLLEELEKIENESPELLGAVSEIRINRKPFDGFDLMLYPVHNPVRVRLENNLNENTLRYVMLMLDVFEEQDSGPGEIDFRSGMGSYTVKETHFGK